VRIFRRERSFSDEIFVHEIGKRPQFAFEFRETADLQNLPYQIPRIKVKTKVGMRKKLLKPLF